MHELSIAVSIVEIAQEEVRKAGGSVVDAIVLEIGTLSGVELAALDFAWPEAVKATVLEKATKSIACIPGFAQCLTCSHTYTLENMYDLCPACHDFRKELLQGKEIRIKSLIIS